MSSEDLSMEERRFFMATHGLSRLLDSYDRCIAPEFEVSVGKDDPQIQEVPVTISFSDGRGTKATLESITTSGCKQERKGFLFFGSEPLRPGLQFAQSGVTAKFIKDPKAFAPVVTFQTSLGARTVNMASMLDRGDYDKVNPAVVVSIAGGTFDAPLTFLSPAIQVRDHGWPGPAVLRTSAIGSVQVEDGKVYVFGERTMIDPASEHSGYPRSATHSGRVLVFDLNQVSAENPALKNRKIVLRGKWIATSNGVNSQTRTGENCEVSLAPASSVVRTVGGAIGGGASEGSSAKFTYSDFDILLVKE